MKTDISIPNPIYHAAEKLAKELGISLSELYIAALTNYVYEYEKKSVTDKLNEVYAAESSSIEPELIKMQIASYTPRGHKRLFHACFAGLKPTAQYIEVG